MQRYQLAAPFEPEACAALVTSLGATERKSSFQS